MWLVECLHTNNDSHVLDSILLLCLLRSRFKTHHVLALGEEADFEALNCLLILNLIRSAKLLLSTEPAFLPNACCAFVLYSFNSTDVASAPNLETWSPSGIKYSLLNSKFDKSM